VEVEKFEIEGPLLLKPRLFYDNRGYFFESFNQVVFNSIVPHINFVQDNESSSAKDVLRGLHFQNPPFEQGKLVRVTRGSVQDYIVDIRKSSPTYGKYISVFLSGENHHQFWIPPGFAHGFLTLESDTLFLYKCTNLYHKDSESGLVWNDPDLNIDWKIISPIVSEKDAELPKFCNLDSRF
jgi:dTDP-4-dehydrorhamnose 3,5-epimerase